MSTHHSSQAQPARDAEKNAQHGQAPKWGEIGISAVAAAAAQASANREVKSGGQPNKVVTLRDIEHLAA